MRVTVITLLALLALSACSAPRKSVAELEAPRSNAARAVETPAPDYPYTWRPRQLPKEPACYDAAMCYDEKRKVCVLFGGSRNYLEQKDETFTWDGRTWIQLDSWQHPSPRASHRMVYDVKGETVVLFGGRCGYQRLNDTWLLDGTGWRRGASEPSPTPRAGHAMAYDAERNVTVLFGGCTGYGVFSNETWEFDGSQWTKREIKEAPAPRSDAAMAFDVARKTLVLFGGRAGDSDSDALDDTWEFDGQQWQRVACEARPEALCGAELVFDSVAGRLLLLGGEYPGGQLRNDAFWQFNGREWSKSMHVEWPRPRSSCATSFDARRQVVVVHGGWGWCPMAMDDTWELVGGTWSECRALSMEPANGWLVYDEHRDRTVLLGQPLGYGSEAHLTVWEWDGLEWKHVAVPFGPPALFRGFACYDPLRRSVVLVLLEANDRNPPSEAQNWSWNGHSWSVAENIPAIPESIEALIFDRRRNTYTAFAANEATESRSRLLNTTWTLEQGQWRKENVSGGPPANERTQCVFDESRGESVFIGFEDSGEEAVRTTWCWNGTSWRKARGAPDIINGTVMAYDAKRERIVCFGGGGGMEEPSYFDATWEWDGTSWTRKCPSSSPRARCNALAAFDRKRGVVVMFGGESSWECASDTWEYGPDRP